MPDDFDQSTSPLLIHTPFGDNKLLLRNFEGEERVSGLFRYTLELISEDFNLDYSEIVGKNATLEIKLPSGDSQYVNGVVGRFVQAGRDARFATYYADLHPWLWLLGMNTNCQIFQNQTAPDIIKKVFSDLGFTDVKDSLTATYQSRLYCVQYNETALAFVSRLMEEEGIFYFFEHTSSAHTLVLADDSSAYAACPGLATATMREPMEGVEIEDAVLDCRLEHQLVTESTKLDDFNFTTPSTDLLATSGSSDSKRVSYRYPGFYDNKSDGEARASLRLAALEAPKSRLSGSSTCRAFHTGCKFTLAGHYRDDANTDYVLLSVTHKGNQLKYSNSFEAMPTAAAYRPPLATPRPAVPGCQTATVVGKSGEEIWTDEYGRVKCKFHWDQSDAQDETASCWIRVAQGWAGKQWGAFFLPRIGQEVVVSFEHGDPDRPLVTGSVYNAEQTVPYGLPDEQTKSTVKSHSSPNQDGFNEIRLEDKAGSEELFIQAQKDMNVNVLNDQTVTVSQNRTVTVSEKDETLTVDKGNRVVQVNTGNETHSVKGTRDLAVTGNETHKGDGDFSQTVGGDFSLKVTGNLSIEVTGSVSIKAGSSFTNQAGESLTNQAGESLTNAAGESLTNQAGESITNQAGESVTNQAGEGITNQAGTSITNQAGVSIDSTAAADYSIQSGGSLALVGAMVQLG